MNPFLPQTHKSKIMEAETEEAFQELEYGTGYILPFYKMPYPGCNTTMLEKTLHILMFNMDPKFSLNPLIFKWFLSKMMCYHSHIGWKQTIHSVKDRNGNNKEVKQLKITITYKDRNIRHKLKIVD
jgi:hypothetical protein